MSRVMLIPVVVVALLFGAATGAAIGNANQGVDAQEAQTLQERLGLVEERLAFALYDPVAPTWMDTGDWSLDVDQRLHLVELGHRRLERRSLPAAVEFQDQGAFAFYAVDPAHEFSLVCHIYDTNVSGLRGSAYILDCNRATFVP